MSRILKIVMRDGTVQTVPLQDVESVKVVATRIIWERIGSTEWAREWDSHEPSEGTDPIQTHTDPSQTRLSDYTPGDDDRGHPVGVPNTCGRCGAMHRVRQKRLNGRCFDCVDVEGSF